MFAFRADVTQILSVNTNLVNEGAINSYKDLLDPKWRSKIVMYDPSIPGTGQYAFRVVGGALMGFDFWRQLVKNDLIVTRDRNLLSISLANGKYAISIGCDNRLTREYINKGAPLKLLNPHEGGYLTSGVGNLWIFKEVPSTNVQKVFLNWFLSKEGQTLYSKVAGEQSARIDVPTEHLDPGIIRTEGGNIFNTFSEEWLIEKYESDMKMLQEIFGPLLK